MNEEILNQLHQLGLSVNEAKVYGNLLGKSSYSATEISNIAGVPRQMIYKVLDSLTTRGLCVLKHDKIKKYSAADPQVGLKHLVEEQERKAQMSQELLQTLQTYFQAGQKEENPLEYIKIFKEKKQIAELFQKLEKDSEKEILIFTKAPFALSLENNKMEFETLAKGVINKSLYESNEIIKKNYFNTIDTLVSAGEEARVAEKLPIKLAVFDEKRVLLALRDPITHHPSITTILIEHSDFAKVMKTAFENKWDSATSWEEFKKANSNIRKNV